jgi:Tfp pilus assembly protein PilN
MPYINLIHEQRQAARAEANKTRTALFSFVGVTTLSLLLAGTQVIAKESTESETANLKKNLARIQPMLKEIDSMKAEITSLRPRLDTLQNATAQTEKWNQILQHMRSSTPEALWLTDIRSKAGKPADGVQFTIKGSTIKSDVSNQRVSELMQKMELCAAIENINLKFTEEDKVNEQDVLSFEILARVAGTVVEEDGKKAKPKSGSFTEKRQGEKEASA